MAPVQNNENVAAAEQQPAKSTTQRSFYQSSSKTRFQLPHDEQSIGHSRNSKKQHSFTCSRS